MPFQFDEPIESGWQLGRIFVKINWNGTSVLSQKFADKVSHSGQALWVGPFHPDEGRAGPTIAVDQEEGF